MLAHHHRVWLVDAQDELPGREGGREGGRGGMSTCIFVFLAFFPSRLSTFPSFLHLFHSPPAYRVSDPTGQAELVVVAFRARGSQVQLVACL
jgi:hypothetical protein